MNNPADNLACRIYQTEPQLPIFHIQIPLFLLLPLVQIVEDLLAGTLVPILPGWFRPPVECYIATSRTAWHLKRVRVFFEWYARALQALFASYEAQASAVVGLPRDDEAAERSTIFRT